MPLAIDEETSGAARTEYERDPLVMTWWGSSVECVSALARLEREGRLDDRDMARAIDRLVRLAGSWTEVAPSARLRQTAERLLRVHPLRAGDALQLAAALTGADDEPSAMPFVTLDERLSRAAEREAFVVVRPGSAGTGS